MEIKDLTLDMAIKHIINIIKEGTYPIFALYGDLGAGKTYLVKRIGQFLKIKDTISSPTFLILKTYTIPNKSQLLVHTDFYRLKDNPNPSILHDIALFDYIDQDIIFMEWPDVIIRYLPKSIQNKIINIYISKDMYNNRTYKIIVSDYEKTK